MFEEVKQSSDLGVLEIGNIKKLQDSGPWGLENTFACGCNATKFEKVQKVWILLQGTFSKQNKCCCFVPSFYSCLYLCAFPTTEKRSLRCTLPMSGWTNLPSTITFRVMSCVPRVFWCVCAWLARVIRGHSRNRNVSWKHQHGESFHCKGLFRNHPGGTQACLFHSSSLFLFALIHFCNSYTFNPLSVLSSPAPVSQPFLLSGQVCYKIVECSRFFFYIGEALLT